MGLCALNFAQDIPKWLGRNENVKKLH